MVYGAVTVEASVNGVLTLLQTRVELKSATGRGITVTFCVSSEMQPLANVAVSVAGYVPASGYWWEGDCWALLFPSPKSQSQSVMAVLCTVWSENTVGPSAQAVVEVNASAGIGANWTDMTFENTVGQIPLTPAL
jgi:hypothetical protein